MKSAIMARGANRGRGTLRWRLVVPSAVWVSLWLGLMVAALAACTPAAAPATPAAPPANLIELHAAKLKLTMGGQPAETITVKAGEPYTFRLVIDEPRDHNLYIGSADDLSHQRVEALVGVALLSGPGSAEFTTTFEAGQTVQFACTLAGHYGTMHGDIIVEP